MNVVRLLFWTAIVTCWLASPLRGDESPREKEAAAKEKEKDKDKEAVEVPADLSTDGMVALAKDGGVWIDKKHKWVVLDGAVCLQRGVLEMFACPKQTKEHESIIAVNAKPSTVHAGLIAVGAKPGKPSTYVPKYEPVTGPEVEIWVLWKDMKGEPRKVRAQEWVRDVKTKKEMDSPWIFGGSKIWQNPTTKEKFYQGDGGDFICVSNFPTATLDIPIASSQSDQDLLFEAFTERIPEPGTKVRLVLVPKVEEEKEKK